LKDFKPYLHDILDRIARIRRHVAGYDYESFCADEKTVDAVIRNIEVIGEAARHIPGDTRQQYPEVPWKSISGMRDKLIHNYLGVDLEYVFPRAKLKATSHIPHHVHHIGRRIP